MLQTTLEPQTVCISISCMSSRKIVIADFGTRHINSLVSLVHRFVPDEDIRLVRIMWPGKDICTLKFDIPNIEYVRNSLELSNLRDTDSCLILSGGPDTVGSKEGFRSMSDDIYYEFEKPILCISYSHHLFSTVVDPNCHMIPHGERGRTMLLPHPFAMQDPIFSKLPPGFMVANFHDWAISKIPRGFHQLGETRGAHSVISALKHDFRPIYTFQFHPEIPVPGYWAGPEIFKQFIEMALPVAVPA